MDSQLTPKPGRSITTLFFLFASLFLLSIFALLVSSAPIYAQTVADPMAIHSSSRITTDVESGVRVPLRGNRHPFAHSQFEVGTVAPDLEMKSMMLVLAPSPEQQQALESLIAAQRDPASPYYHRWLTPEEFGEHFGPTAEDVQRVASWLQSKGMTVDEVASSRRSIRFSGTSAQIENAFAAGMRQYKINGVLHIANSADPTIPQALAPVVNGVLSLHDFRPRASHSAVKPTPDVTFGSSYYLSPGDLATIYDVNPLYTQGLTGSGQSVAVVGRSNINQSDISTFRSLFGLPTNAPTVIVNGTDPGTSNSDELVEASLDAEYAGALAKNATVQFVASSSTATTDGAFLSAQYIVNHNIAPVMTMSFSLCEAWLGTSGNAFINSLWQQAAAQGITVLVSSGDNGAAGCDSASSSTAVYGRAVNGLCSSPYDLCVGGTVFNDTSSPSTYWSSSNSASYTSALRYIPENVWNDGSDLWASGGGASTIYSKPAWQTGKGVPSDGMRDVPDLSLSASGHDPYIIVMDGNEYAVSGTSAATPTLAGIFALINQSTGSRQGAANQTLYTLATAQNSGGGAVFHDITSGTNTVPGCTGYSATAGYDEATGLGSVDASVLVSHWTSAQGTLSLSLASTATTVAPSGSSTYTANLTGGSSSQTVTLSATGLPTGVTATFAPASLTFTGSGSSKLTLAVASSVAAGTYTFTVTATNGTLTSSTKGTITVLAPSFTLTDSATAATIAPGASGTFTFTTAGNATFNSAVAFAVSGLPTGITGTWAPTSIAAPGSGSSTLTLAAASTTAAGNYTVTVTATAGSLSQTAKVTLTVLAPAFTLKGSATALTIGPGGSGSLSFTTAGNSTFNSAVALSVSGLPTGATGTFSPTSIAAPGNGSSTLTLAAASTTAAGNYTVKVTATAGSLTQTASFTLTVLAPAFTLKSSATALTIGPGGSTGSLSFTTAGNATFNSAVVFTVTGLPTGATGTWAPTSITAPGNGSSTLTLAAASTAAVGNYTVKVTATAGSLTQTSSFTLTVLAPSFTLKSSATALTIGPLGKGSLSFTTAGNSTFNSAVALTVSGLPTGVTGTFSPTSITAPGSGSSTLTLAAASTAAVGNYTVKVTATAGSLTQTASFTLTVLAPSFTLKGSATAVTIGPGGSSGSLSFTTAGNTTFNSAVALTVSGLPTGVTGSFSPASIAAPGSGSSTLTLAAASTTAAGNYTVNVTATAGSLTQTATFTLNVLAPSFTLKGSATTLTVGPGGKGSLSFTSAGNTTFNSAVALSVSGLPTGVTGSFSPASIPAPGNGSSTLTLAAAGTTAVGNYTITVTATAGSLTQTAQFTLTVLAPSFTLKGSATSVTVAPAGKGTISFASAGNSTFSSAVALSVSGLPTGVTGTWAPTSIAAPGNGSSTLTLSAASTTATGVYTVTVTATAGSLAQTAQFTLNVPSLSASAGASTLTITRGATATLTITTVGGNGLSSAVGLAASGLPTGVTASFSPASIASPGSGTSKLTLTASSTATLGTSKITITANGGGLSTTASVSLTVGAATSSSAH
jgi:subtilase family serine protease